MRLCEAALEGVHTLRELGDARCGRRSGDVRSTVTCESCGPHASNQNRGTYHAGWGGMARMRDERGMRRALRVGGGLECGRELRTACIFVAAHRSGVVVCTLTCKCAGRMRRITVVAHITPPVSDERHMSDAPFECAAGRSAGGRDVQAASSLMAAEESSCTGSSAMNCKWELQVGETACMKAQHDRR